MNGSGSRSIPAPGFFISQRKAWWRQRMGKFYNPPCLCTRCDQPTSPHQKYCPACIALFRWQGFDSLDYQETLTDIRSDWHP